MTKSIYLAGWEVVLNGDEQCQRFMETQCTNKSTLDALPSGIELVFEEDQLVGVYEYEEGEMMGGKELKEEEIGMPYEYYEPKSFFQFEKDENGPHQLGGEKPNDFQFPENNCEVPFQYIGFINDEDLNFSFLPFTLHLVCPIFLEIDKVFLDYSNPNFPVLLNREEVERAENSFPEDLNASSEIIYHALRMRAEESVSFYDDDGIGAAGVPVWIQYPMFPTCPKSGRLMRFVCQLTNGVSAKSSNVVPHNEHYRRYFEKLNFCSDGDLFVFFEPESKVACYFMQHT
jgi:hypothetical protein